MKKITLEGLHPYTQLQHFQKDISYNVFPAAVWFIIVNLKLLRSDYAKDGFQETLLNIQFLSEREPECDRRGGWANLHFERGQVSHNMFNTEAVIFSIYV